MSAPPVLNEIPPHVDDVVGMMTLTNQKRMEIVNAFTRNGKMTEDPKEASVIIKALADMDKSVVTKKRIGIEEASVKSTEEEAHASAELLKAIKHNMFQAVGAPTREIPELGSHVPEPELVPGETEIGISNMTYDSFTKGLPA